MSLIPIDVDHFHTATPHNSHDGAFFVAGSDGLDYVAKCPSAAAPELPAVEHLAYGLCKRLGLAVPASAWLRFEDGRIGFGSRWETGVQQYTLLDAEARAQALLTCKAQIARFCLLDAFLANPDRHADNLLFRRSPLDQRWTVLNIDFSRALWQGGFPQRPPRETFRRDNTGALVHLLLTVQAFNVTMIASVTASLAAITQEQIAMMVADIPETALTDQVRRLPAWWGSAARLERIAQLNDILT